MSVLAQRQNDVAALIGLADIAGAEMKWEEAKGYIARARSAAPDDPGLHRVLEQRLAYLRAVQIGPTAPG